MRELRVIGLTPDSAHIVCVDTETGVKYRLAADEKLRAAARGDLARFGQIEIEMEATMRPRDIQARIRAGASVEQVTEESGMPTSRVERFAYPVLLERARAAELAQRAHPVRGDGPAVETLLDVVTAAFAERGHNSDIAEWDAWKDEKGHWVAQLQWQAGRSVIAAHWRFQPDAHGGSVTPLDDPATDLIDPDFGRALRGLATILPESADEPAPVDTVVAASSAPEPAQLAPEDPAPAAHEPAPIAAEASEPEYFEQRAAVGGGAIPVAATGTDAPTGTAAPAPSQPAPKSGPPATPPAGPGTAGAAPAVNSPTAPPHSAPTQPAEPAAPATPAAPAASAPAERSTQSAQSGKAANTKPAGQKSRSKRNGKAPMPSWEDVLLGVRSSGH
ncbi:septation protein SepH [Nocardia mexicana]|uniref:DUF3071 family protein n=3 Tax=Nocardia mexicana TaxID=279262 RepID=A0A370GM22_9NOCA|nr:septation protein SepH [Nocardia mexicana]RDI43454.1 DUF3071 family protein [Nocardia mexicana]